MSFKFYYSSREFAFELFTVRFVDAIVASERVARRISLPQLGLDMKACERGHPLDTGLHVDAARMDEPRVPEDDQARVPREPVSFEVVGQLVHILERGCFRARADREHGHGCPDQRPSLVVRFRSV